MKACAHRACYVFNTTIIYGWNIVCIPVGNVVQTTASIVAASLWGCTCTDALLLDQCWYARSKTIKVKYSVAQPSLGVGFSYCVAKSMYIHSYM